MIDIPIPAPRYKSAAIIAGGISVKSILESGILIAYRAADKIAQNIAVFCFAFQSLYTHLSYRMKLSNAFLMSCKTSCSFP